MHYTVEQELANQLSLMQYTKDFISCSTNIVEMIVPFPMHYLLLLLVEQLTISMVIQSFVLS